MTEELTLEQFLPFRLNRLAAEVSTRLYHFYADRFGIDVPQWRVMATLGEREPVTAQAVVDSTRTNKSTISRAVGRLEALGWVERVASETDRRQFKLRFTPAGRAVYDKIVPLVLKAEREMLDSLADADRRALLDGLAALEASLGLTREE